MWAWAVGTKGKGRGCCKVSRDREDCGRGVGMS